MKPFYVPCVSMILVSAACLFDLQAALPVKGMIIFGSKRSGAWRIWRMEVDGSNMRQISPDVHEAVMPIISADGRWIMYKMGNTGSAGDLYIMRNDGSEAQAAVQGTEDTGVPAAVVWNGSGFYYQKNDRIYLFDPETKISVEKFNFGAFTKFTGGDRNFKAMTADERWILVQAYKSSSQTYQFDNHEPASGGAMILDANAVDMLYYFGNGCEPSAAPSGSTIYHVNGEGWPNTDIYKMNIGDVATRSSYALEIGYPDAEWGHEYWPKVSNDNLWLIYGASTGCHPHYDCPYEIFIHELGKSGDRTRLTNDDEFDCWPDLWVGDVPDVTLTPDIILSHTSMTFQAIAGGANPADQAVTVSSVNGQSLEGLEANESAGWLAVAVGGTGDSRTLTNTVSVAGLAAGNYSTEVSVTAGAITKTYSVELSISDALALQLKMNAGNNVVPDWEPDDPYVSGGADYVKNDHFDMNNAVDPGPEALYQTVRHLGPSFTFGQIPDGAYKIRLHFADPAYDTNATASTRAMDVMIENDLALHRYDIVFAAGGGHKVVIEEFVIGVNDGNGLSIGFDKKTGDDAFVAGIEIIGTNDTPSPAFRIISPGAGTVWEAGTEVSIEWSAVNAQNAVIEYSTDDGLSWEAIATNAAIMRGDINWGTYIWTVPDMPSASCRLRIGTYEGEGLEVSDAFEITSADVSKSEKCGGILKDEILIERDPAGGDIVFRCTLTHDALIRLRLYGIDGRLVETLYDGERRAGTLIGRLPAQRYANRMLIASIETSGRKYAFPLVNIAR